MVTIFYIALHNDSTVLCWTMLNDLTNEKDVMVEWDFTGFEIKMSFTGV